MEPPGPPMEPQAPKRGDYLWKSVSRGASNVFDFGSQIFTKTQKCLSAPLETVRSHFHKSYVTNNASALFIRQPKNQSTLTFPLFDLITTLWIKSSRLKYILFSREIFFQSICNIQLLQSDLTYFFGYVSISSFCSRLMLERMFWLLKMWKRYLYCAASKLLWQFPPLRKENIIDK